MVRHLALAALALGAAAPLTAQDNGAVAAPPAAPADNIGPRELSNFSLNGTVTRQAAPSTVAPSPATSTREPAVRASTSGTEPVAPRRTATVRPKADAMAPGPAIDPIASRPTLRQPSRVATAAASSPAFSRPVTLPSAPIEASGGFSPLPWIAALLLLAAGGVVYFGRQRQRQRQGYAGAGASELAGVPAEHQPAAPPPVRAPQPRLDPVPAPSGTVTSSLRVPSPPVGTVASSLRPWIELELEPSQAMVTDEHAAIAFDVTLFNSGSAPARDVAVEARLINAGQRQDTELNAFYATPGGAPDKIPAVAPMARITLKSAVRLPRSAVQEYEVEGRKLFMPMVAVNSRYRWSSGEGQSAASFLVGPAANDGGRLAPLRLDKGQRGWKALAARRYEKGIRR